MSSQVVVITGAASGIGKAIALTFAKLNASLCITDINKEDLHKTMTECHKLSKNKVLEIVADLGKDEDPENIIETTLKEFGRIDVLVNCAGIYEPTCLQNPDVIAKFDKIVGINLRSVIALINKAAAALIESKGCIINISSAASNLILSNSLIYVVSKAGLKTLTKYAAVELARFGVRVNCISPGPVKTNILSNMGISDYETDKAMNDFVEKTLLKKIVKVEEIVEMVVYLASDKAASITGADIVVDAGFALGAC